MFPKVHHQQQHPANPANQPQFNFITSAFNAQIDQKKEAAKIRLRREMDFIVHDLFSLFSAEFNRQLYCHLGNAAANALKHAPFRSLTSGNSPFLNTSLLADAFVNQVFGIGNNNPLGYKENFDSANLAPVPFNPSIGIATGGPQASHQGVIVKKVVLDGAAKRPLNKASSSPIALPVPGTSKLKANHPRPNPVPHSQQQQSDPNSYNHNNQSPTQTITEPVRQPPSSKAPAPNIPTTSKTLIVPLIRKNGHKALSPKAPSSSRTNANQNQCHLNSMVESEDDDDCECADCTAEEIKMESIEDHGNADNVVDDDVDDEDDEDDDGSNDGQPLTDSPVKRQRTFIVSTKPSLAKHSLVEQPFSTTSIQTSTIIPNPNFQAPRNLPVILSSSSSFVHHNHNSSEHYQIALNPEDVLENEDDNDLDVDVDNDQPQVVVPSRKYRTLCLKCTIHDCLDMFKTRAMLHKHLFDVHQVLPNQCVVNGCNKSFNQKLTDHVRTEHAHLTEWQCRNCHKVFKHYQPLYNHISRAHLEGQFECAAVAGCGYIGRFRGEMEAHYYRVHNRHNLQKPYRCTWTGCSFVSSWASHAIRHIRVNHLNLPKTLKEQRERNIIEDRNPMDYLEVIQEATG